MKREAGGLGVFFFCPQRSKRSHAVCTAGLHLPSKSYENRMKRSAFVQFSRNRGN